MKTITTDAGRNDAIDELLDNLVSEMEVRGLVQDEVAAWRCLISKGLFNLPSHLCPDHLRQDLKRYQTWIEHDLENLAPQTH